MQITPLIDDPHFRFDDSWIESLRKQGLEWRHEIIKVSESMSFALTEASFPRNISLSNYFSNPEARVGFNFCTAGATNFGLSGGLPTARATTAKVNNFVMPACEVVQDFLLSPRLELVTLYVDVSLFLQLIGENIETLPVRLIDAAQVDDKCYFESYEWQPLIRPILAQVFHTRMGALSQRLFIESKALELMALVLETYSRDQGRKLSVSRSNIERIQYAKELLLRDLSNPPSLSKLARAAGTNEFTLKKGFKELFDVPVFKYLQQVRMAKSYELFQATNLPVSEVSLMVGYESESSFIRAFHETYNINPGEVKRIPFKTI